MSKTDHVSGLSVGPLLDQDTHDAIVATRERRKQVSQTAAADKAKRSASRQSGKSKSSTSEG
jgi:hypothetical protein